MKPSRKRRIDRHGLIRDLPGALTPPLFKPRTRIKGADPESILQGEVNDCLKQIGQFQFRLSERVYANAGDWTIAGWPDDPLIMRLAPGLSLLCPLELKARGGALNPDQIAMKPILGTVVADTWEDAYAYILWARSTAAHIEKLLKHYPPAPLPAAMAKRYTEAD